jgi:hypothetical protein
MHAGVSRYSIGWFVLTRKDFNDLIQGISPGNPNQVFPLVFTSNQGPGLTLQVIIAGAEPLSTSTGNAGNVGQQVTDMMRVKVIDQRALLFTPVTKSYNVMSQPFGWDTANSQPYYYSQTFKTGTTPWTWAQIVADITSCPVMPAGAPTWTPNNLLWDNVPLAQLIDNLMSRVYYVVGWDIATDTLTCNVPGTMNVANTALFNQAMATCVLAGGKGTRNLSRAPAAFKVGIQASNADSPNNPFDLSGGYTRTYTSTVTVNADSPGITQPLAVGEAIAIWSGGMWANSSDLSSIANDIAPRAYTAMTCDEAQWEFAGIWPFSPDGAIRGVKWVSDAGKAKTVIRINNDRDFMPLDDLRRVMETWSNQLLTPLGNSNVGMDSGSGARQTWANLSGAQFATLVDDMSGGNASTPTGYAAYKYNLFDFLTGNQVASGLSPTTARPMGILTGPAGYGFYIVKAGVTYLLYPDEQPNLVACT